MVLSGFQWFLGSYKQKGWDRNKATAGESIYACRPMDSPFCIRNHWEPLMSMFANNALLGGGGRGRVWIREQRKIKRRSKALLCL